MQRGPPEGRRIVPVHAKAVHVHVCQRVARTRVRLRQGQGLRSTAPGARCADSWPLLPLLRLLWRLAAQRAQVGHGLLGPALADQQQSTLVPAARSTQHAASGQGQYDG